MFGRGPDLGPPQALCEPRHYVRMQDEQFAEQLNLYHFHRKNVSHNV